METETNQNLNNHDIDTILLNLKMLSQIKANDKLYTDGSNKNRYTYYYARITRWMNDYSRTKSMDYLDHLINKTLEYVNENIKKAERTEEDNRNCQKILVEVSKSLTEFKTSKLHITMIHLFKWIGCYKRKNT